MSRPRQCDGWPRVAATCVAASFAMWSPSCTVGPDAAPLVDPPAADALPVPARAGVAADLTVASKWWELVDDPVLHGLVARAEAHNTSLEASLGAVRAAYAGVGVGEAQLWPTVGLGAQYARTLTNIAQLAAEGVRSEPYDMYAYGIGMSAWEIDLWGSVRRQVEVAKADAAKQVELLRDALVSVRAQVGAVYGQLRTLEARRAVLARSVEVYSSIRDTVRARHEAGVVTALDVARVEAQLDAARAQLPQVDAGIAGAVSQLAVLCGAGPAEIAGVLQPTGAIPAVPEVVGIGLPADLVERRPDVRAAREELRAATERIGIAEAAKLPTISISGNFYIAANAFSGLGDLANKAYTIGPSVWWPIFEGGRLDAQAAQQRALAEAALARYRGAILEALADLSASTGDFVEAREGVRLAGTARASAARARELAERQFDAGVTDITVLLDVRRQELDAERAEVEARGVVVQAFVSLCRALGGGWTDADLDRAAADAATDTTLPMERGQ